VTSVVSTARKGCPAPGAGDEELAAVEGAQFAGRVRATQEGCPRG
jgi:hypothetical protein